nr:MAG TPA: Large Terminase [Caudoviricetes sp.]
MKKAEKYIREILADEDVFIDDKKIEKAKELIERYFKMPLFDWELFVLGLIHCYYKSTDTVVFTEFFIMMGRGNGKNGFISGIVWYLTTHYHGVDGYNVDIIANSEDQAKTSFDDIYEMLDRTWTKSQKFFKKTKLLITNTKTNSYIKFNTANAKTKDGKRSACLVFDEIHEYQDGSIIGVFKSGFGKRKHSRIFSITTNGYVRDGVLDEKLRIARGVLDGEIKGSRLCPLIYKLDNDAEAQDKDKWVKANPSLPYLPNLQIQMEQENLEAQFDDIVKINLYTKRFNLPRADLEIAVTDYENIKATNVALPDLTRQSCTAGIDYAELTDWAAVNLHFKIGDKRYDINHAWMCLNSKDLHRVKAPWKEWAEKGLITVVDDVSIHPDLLCEYIKKMSAKYNVRMVAMDTFRHTLMAESLRKIGFDARDKTKVKLIRPSDIMQVEPVVQECFNRNLFVWGDNPCLRWAVNNTKRMRSSRNIGADTGNFVYGKIEAKSRKTDPFMALAASMCCEDVLISRTVSLPPVGAIAF